jgi:ornithine cyclodeaminase/alanine dehydrogenase
MQTMKHTSGEGQGDARPAATLFLTDRDVEQLADWAGAVEALRTAYGTDSPAEMFPPRTMARGDGAWLRSLSAVMPGGGLLGSKLIAATPKHGYASYLISLFNTQSAALEALIDGNQVTGIRTAATSVLAIDALAPRKPLRVGVIGSGFEAHGQLAALAAVREIASAAVFSPSPQSRQRFVRRFAEEARRVNVRDAATPEAAVDGADVVICAARSHDESPVLRGRWLVPGMTVVSIGSTLPEQREVDEEVIARADLIVADMTEEVSHDTGDMIAATRAGVPFAHKLVPLSDLVSGRHAGRSAPDSIVLFKSVGAAMQDVVVAAMLLRRARERSVGTPLPVSIVPVAKWNTPNPSKGK